MHHDMTAVGPAWHLTTTTATVHTMHHASSHNAYNSDHYSNLWDGLIQQEQPDACRSDLSHRHKTYWVESALDQRASLELMVVVGASPAPVEQGVSQVDQSSGGGQAGQVLCPHHCIYQDRSGMLPRTAMKEEEWLGTLFR